MLPKPLTALCGLALLFSSPQLAALAHAAGHSVLGAHAHLHDGSAHSHGHDGDAHHHEVARAGEFLAPPTAPPSLLRPPGGAAADILSPAPNGAGPVPPVREALFDTGPPKPPGPLLSLKPADRAPPA